MQTDHSAIKRISELSRFIEEVERIISDWSPDREFYPWFRGVPDTSYPLIPRLYRPECKTILEWDKEGEIRLDFKRDAWPYLPATARERDNEWERYFLMQHYGLLTRLLDWSQSALVALYFAVREPFGKNRGKDAAVWVLDPYELNDKVLKKGPQLFRLFRPGDQEIEKYLPDPRKRPSPPLPRRPIALEAPFHSEYIAAQKGVFTLHGKSQKGLETYKGFNRYLMKIEIIGEAVPKLKEQLSVAGISEARVFPDLQHVCRDLFDYWTHEDQKAAISAIGNRVSPEGAQGTGDRGSEP